MIFIVLDVLKPLQHKRLIEKELEGFGIRLNKQPPNIVFKKKDKGGINLQCLVPQSELDIDLVKTILSEYRISSADITLKYDATADDLIDVVEGNRSYIPCIYLLNKIDQISVEELDIICEIPHCVPISAHHKWNYDSLLEKMWDYLQLVTSTYGTFIFVSARHVVCSVCAKSPCVLFHRSASTPSRKVSSRTTRRQSCSRAAGAPSRTSATSSTGPSSRSSSTRWCGDRRSSISRRRSERTTS